jgi:hypothetical protein
LKKEPRDRPQSVAELAAMLGEVPMAEEWTPQRAERWWKKNFPARTA